MTSYLNLHLALEQIRENAAQQGEQGPRVCDLQLHYYSIVTSIFNTSFSGSCPRSSRRWKNIPLQNITQLCIASRTAAVTRFT